MGGIALPSGCKAEVFSQLTKLNSPSTAKPIRVIRPFHPLGVWSRNRPDQS